MSQQKIHKKRSISIFKDSGLPVVTAPALARMGRLCRSRMTETVVLRVCVAHLIFPLSIGVVRVEIEIALWL
jgi:hypothetical protein